MAKRTFLKLTNSVLRYINQAEISSVVSPTGHSAIVIDKFNEAVTLMYTETNWYSLFKERKFQTSQNISVTILDYTSTGDTITITRNGVATVLTEGVDWSNATSNEVSAVALAAGIVASFGTTNVETEVTNAGVVIRNRAENSLGFTVVTTSDSAVYTVALVNNGLYDMADDFGRSIALLDKTNGQKIYEASPMAISDADPDDSEEGNARNFAAFGDKYRLYPIPSSVIIITDRFYKIPATLATDSQLCDLPLECEPILVKYVQSEMAYYMNNSIKGSSLKSHYTKMLAQAVEMNEYIINKQTALASRNSGNSLPMAPAQFPSGYPRN
jgi:hypothetical protein